MKDVWVVLEGDWTTTDVLGVFESAADAEAFAEERKALAPTDSRVKRDVWIETKPLYGPGERPA